MIDKRRSFHREDHRSMINRQIPVSAGEEGIRSLTVGEKISNCFNGKDYRVKSVAGGMVVLEAEDKLSQLLASVDCLELLYEMMESTVTQPPRRGVNSVNAVSNTRQV